LRHYLARQAGQDNRDMRALPFHRDRAMTSAAASASTSGIGSGFPRHTDATFPKLCTAVTA
jgi:hypothetical protein